MRNAKAPDLNARILPILTARVSASELAQWFPVPLQQVANPYDIPDVCRAAVAELETGQWFSIDWRERPQHLTFRIPANVNAAEFVSELLKEIPLPRVRILWRRKDVRLPRSAARARREGKGGGREG